MLFHSPGFLLVFFPVFLIAVHAIPKGQARGVVLLCFSYLFYSGAEPFFIFLLLLSSVTDYLVALRIAATNILLRRRLWLTVSILINLSILGFFKYGGWVIPNLLSWQPGLGFLMPDEDFFQGFILPAGISFYTFQSMAYTIDVYRRETVPEKSLLHFCNYVAYLPQLIAGPIERFNHLAPQLEAFRNGLTRPQWSAGLDRIFLGIIQKLILADGCGYIVDRMVGYGSYEFFSSWAVSIGFGMQIYFDFAAYTHMAIGISLILGVRLRENFLAPYQAASIREFWRRWHVTLSSWFRDYLYIPLGGSRKGNIHTVFNLIVTFLLCGLWHGAGYNFIVWGALHGCYLGFYHVKERLFPELKLPRPLGIAITFTLVCFAWVPFRVADTVTMVDIWSNMLGINGLSGHLVSPSDFVILLLIAAGTILIPHAGLRWPGSSGWKESAVIATVACFAVINSPAVTRFIYFQF